MGEKGGRWGGGRRSEGLGKKKRLPPLEAWRRRGGGWARDSRTLLVPSVVTFIYPEAR